MSSTPAQPGAPWGEAVGSPGGHRWAGTGEGLEGGWGQADAAATGPKPSLSGIIILKVLHN